MNFFSFNFPLREYFFCISPAPTPHKFSNGPSLRIDFAYLHCTTNLYVHYSAATCQYPKDDRLTAVQL